MEPTYSTSIELRYSDIDMYAHVNNVVYFTYFETARVMMFNDFFNELTEKNIFILVAHAECDFLIPIKLGDTLIVSVTIARIGTSSFDLKYRLHNGSEKVYATGSTTMVCFDNEKNVTIPVPQCISSMV